MEKNMVKNAMEKAMASEEYKAFTDAINAKNEAVKKDQYSAINIASTAISEALENLNVVLKNAFYDEIFALADKDIVKAFIETGSIELFAVKNDSKIGEGYVKEGTKMEVLDIMELFNECIRRQNAANGVNRKIFHDSFYLENIDNLCHVIFAAKCKDYGIDPKSNKKYSSYCTMKIAASTGVQSIDTKTSATKAMQGCFDSLVYDETVDKKGNKVNKYKVDTRYEKALVGNFSKWSGKSINGVTFPNYDTFRRMFMRICHMVVTGKELIAE